MRTIKNNYISKEDRYKKVAEEIYSSVLKDEASVLFVKLGNQQFDVDTLLSRFYKDKKSNIIFSMDAIATS